MKQSLQKVVVSDHLVKAASPDLPGHIRHAVDTACAALESARTPMQKVLAQSLEKEALALLTKYLEEANVLAAIKAAHRNPEQFHEIRGLK